MNRYKKEESKRGKPFPPGREMTQEEWIAMLDKSEPLGGIPSDEFMEIAKERSKSQKDGESQKEP